MINLNQSNVETQPRNTSSKLRRYSLMIERKKTFLLEKIGVRPKSRRRTSCVNLVRDFSASHPNCYQLVNSSSSSQLPTSVEEATKIRNLTLLLHDENCRQIFKAFLAKEHSAENLEFWVAVDKYRKEDLPRALSIYNRFLAPGAPDEVNIESKLISQIRDSLTSGHAASNIFDDAKYSIFLLIKRDSYRRFRRWYDAHHI